MAMLLIIIICFSVQNYVLLISVASIENSYKLLIIGYHKEVHWECDFSHDVVEYILTTRRNFQKEIGFIISQVFEIEGISE